MRKPTTRQMSDAHEEFLAGLIGGAVMPGSGNQWARPTDARNRRETPWGFAVDCKSTFNASVGVSLSMWDKVVEQAMGERPMLALRWYADWRLGVTRDLVVVDAHDFAEILDDARKGRGL